MFERSDVLYLYGIFLQEKISYFATGPVGGVLACLLPDQYQ